MLQRSISGIHDADYNSMYLNPGEDPYLFIVSVERDDFTSRDETSALTEIDDLPHIPFNFNKHDGRWPAKLVEVSQGCGSTACLGY